MCPRLMFIVLGGQGLVGPLAGAAGGQPLV